jgi:hypothetical protein
MTILEAKAKAIANVLVHQTSEWKQEHSDKAKSFVLAAFSAGKLSPEDFAQAVSEVTGNVSQMRQFLEKQGFIAATVTKTALANQIEVELKALHAANDAALNA